MKKQTWKKGTVKKNQKSIDIDVFIASVYNTYMNHQAGWENE